MKVSRSRAQTGSWAEASRVTLLFGGEVLRSGWSKTSGDCLALCRLRSKAVSSLGGRG